MHRTNLRGPTVAANSSSSSGRSASQIEADLGATRDRLAASIEVLIDTVHPNRIKQRTVARLKVLAHEQLERARSLVFNARGDLRTKRLATVGGGVGGYSVFLVVVRAIARRTRRG
ncbi:MAG: hypothetical protein JWP61_254 [Friedmanniella sp.]|nr:hypothetical protein [Friedmanniella sp.]